MQDVQVTGQSSTTANYTWNGVIEFLQEQVRQNTIKQNEWLLEKQHLLAKLGKSEGEIKALETINNDMVKRIKMLEFCLRQERIKYMSLLSNKSVNTPELKNFLENQAQIPASPSNQLANIGLPKKRAKSHKNAILKFLEEVGYDTIYAGNALGDKDFHNQTGIYPSQHNSEMELFKHDELDKVEQLSVLDNSIFKRAAEKSPDQRYSSGDDKGHYDNRYLANEQNSYNGDERSMRNKNANISGTQKDQRNAYHTDSTTPHDKAEWRHKSTLRGHFDGIRDIFVHTNDAILCSVSEDCMIKIWDLNKIKKSRDSSSPIDPYLTFREHTGPLFAMTGPQNEQVSHNDKRLLYTAGSEGKIRVWDVPTASECDTFGLNAKSYCIGSWDAHKDTIWELSHHPLRNAIMSSSSDGYIKIWEIVEGKRGEMLSGKVKSHFYSRGPTSEEPLVPTSAAWIQTSVHHIVAGYANSHSLVVFDEETMKASGTIKYDPYMSGQRVTQPNKLLSHPNLNLLIAAHEDKYLRFFDLKTNKVVHSLQAHNDAVTSVCYNAGTTNIVSVSHDGVLKVWDLRRYGLVQEIAGLHIKKYDEQIHCVTLEESMQLLLTGGADGLISVMERV